MIKKIKRWLKSKRCEPYFVFDGKIISKNYFNQILEVGEVRDPDIAIGVRDYRFYVQEGNSLQGYRYETREECIRARELFIAYWKKANGYGHK